MEKNGTNNSQTMTAADISIDSRNEVTGLKLLVLHTGLCFCTFLVGLDFTLIATAVPSITSEFSSIGDVGWYGGAFYLALCASQPLAGKTFTLFPKNVVYLSYLAVFEIGSLICALAPSSKILIFGRAITGLGASGIFAGGLIIVTTTIPLHKRAIWQGTISSTFALASVVGPVIGGALTQRVTWRWCFYINLPIGGFSAAIVFLFLNVHKAATEKVALSQKLRGLDGLGFLLFAGSIVMLLLALQWGGTTYAWGSSVIIGLFVGAGVMMPLFVAQQLRLKDSALIPPKIFAHRNSALIFASALFSSGPFQTVVYWLPIWFQAVLGVSPTESGIRYLPVVISDVLTSFIGSGFAQVLGYWNPFLLFGFASLSIGCGLLTTLYPAISTGHWIGYQILCGIGYALVVTMSQLGIQASLPPELVPIGVTTLLFVISASCAVYLAVGQTIFQERLVRTLSEVLPPNTVSQVLSVGATQLRSISGDQNPSTIINAYSSAVTKVFFMPAVAPVLSFFFICGTKWISVKKTLKEES